MEINKERIKMDIKELFEAISNFGNNNSEILETKDEIKKYKEYMERHHHDALWIDCKIEIMCLVSRYLCGYSCCAKIGLVDVPYLCDLDYFLIGWGDPFTTSDYGYCLWYNGLCYVKYYNKGTGESQDVILTEQEALGHIMEWEGKKIITNN